MSVGLAEARINLNKLIEERKETAAELARLQDKLGEYAGIDEQGVQAVKRKYLNVDMDSTYCKPHLDIDEDCQASPSKMSRHQLQQRIERIKEEIECKNIQINDIQQMVIEGDQDDRSKHIFNNIRLPSS